MNETEKEKTINIIKVRDDREPIYFRMKDDKTGFELRDKIELDWCSDSQFTKAELRARVEPWLTSLFQSEHFEIVFRYGVAETARTTTKTAPEPLCEKSGRMISPIYIIGIGRRPDFRRARNAVRGDSRRPDMPGLRRRQEQFRRGRGAARKARRSPEKERPAAFRRAVSKKSGGVYNLRRFLLFLSVAHGARLRIKSIQ